MVRFDHSLGPSGSALPMAFVEGPAEGALAAAAVATRASAGGESHVEPMVAARPVHTRTRTHDD
jgi:hypothetical protein